MRKAYNLPPSCAVVTNSGDLNFLEPSGPLRACNGTALYIYTHITAKKLGHSCSIGSENLCVKETNQSLYSTKQAIPWIM